MKVCALTSSISRSAGGVLGSLQPLLKHLRSDGSVEVEIMALEDEFSVQDLDSWLPFAPRLFSVRGPQSFGYASQMSKALKEIRPDVAHTHGIWMYPSVCSSNWSRISGNPYLVTPHGMLDPWALKNSYWKKKVAGLLYEDHHLRKAACLHSLCAAETMAMRQYGLSNPICQIPNGIDLPETVPNQAPPWRNDVEEGQKILLYLGRIHPKKGLVNLLHGWAKAAKGRVGNEWILAVAGWDQGGHEEVLRQLAMELGIDKNVVFVGPQFGEAKAAAYHHADAFILPSLSEGLPMVVLEAWAYGLPVVMTDFCNIPEGFNAAAAVRTDPEPESISQALHMLMSMTDVERAAMGKRGTELVIDKFTWEKVANDMRKVYEWVLGGGAEPQCLMLATGRAV